MSELSKYSKFKLPSLSGTQQGLLTRLSTVQWKSDWSIAWTVGPRLSVSILGHSPEHKFASYAVGAITKSHSISLNLILNDFIAQCNWLGSVTCLRYRPRLRPDDFQSDAESARTSNVVWLFFSFLVFLASSRCSVFECRYTRKSGFVSGSLSIRSKVGTFMSGRRESPRKDTWIIKFVLRRERWTFAKCVTSIVTYESKVIAVVIVVLFRSFSLAARRLVAGFLT